MGVVAGCVVRTGNKILMVKEAKKEMLWTMELSSRRYGRGGKNNRYSHKRNG